MTNLPALREAVAKMKLDYPVVYDAAEMRDGLGFVIVDPDDGVTNEAYGEGIACLLNAAPALLDELEQLREHRRLLILWAEGCAARLPVAERKALNWRDVDVARKAARQAWQAAKETP